MSRSLASGAVALPPLVAAALALLAGCAPARYEPVRRAPTWDPPVGLIATSSPAGADAADSSPPPVGAAAAEPGAAPSADLPSAGELSLATVLESVVRRYPPMLSALVERDLASGRLRQAMGAFDTNLVGKLGRRVQGYYESTIASGVLEQPLVSGDSIFGGYRVSDGLLPDYYDGRTQDNGELVFGVRVPLLRNRAFDERRAGVRKAEIGVALADPKIERARIDFVRAATETYFVWVAAGRRVEVARDLLRLATGRQDGIARAVERQFLAPVDLVDNERLVAQRRVLVLRAERELQAAALALSLYLRDAADRPIVVDESRLPVVATADPLGSSLADDLAAAQRQRPEPRQLALLLDEAATERELANNQLWPALDLVVEGARSLGAGPYSDREDLELFVGGELKLPIQRRAAQGRREQAEARLRRLGLEERFARDRIATEIADAR
ncbi:MAG: TolC family protein, partial [Planctomycetes bacterium]|nr:TolC family protein [Planctomycetota bacterium]